MGTPVETCRYLRGIHSAHIFGPESERWEWWVGDCWSGGANGSTWEWRGLGSRGSFFFFGAAWVKWGARRGLSGCEDCFFLGGGGPGERGGGRGGEWRGGE